MEGELIRLLEACGSRRSVVDRTEVAKRGMPARWVEVARRFFVRSELALRRSELQSGGDEIVRRSGVPRRKIETAR